MDSENRAIGKGVGNYANSGGGCILIGIDEAENGLIEPIGLQKILDKADFSNNISGRIPDILHQETKLYNFVYESSDYAALKGKSFQLVHIPDMATEAPFIAKKDSKETEVGAIYVRRGTKSIEANNDEVTRIINRRIDESRSTTPTLTLDGHLQELCTLFNYLNRFIPPHELHDIFSSLGGIQNNNYPKENFEKFILRMIKLKKDVIESSLKE